jgi:hypothetical protein
MSRASVWRGYWTQRTFGQQAMHDVVLRFGGGTVSGEGHDCVGQFVFQGTCDSHGKVVMVKQYLGMHQVLYQGQYDGEGTLFGTWSIGPFESGEFVLTLVRDRQTSDEIAEIL